MLEKSNFSSVTLFPTDQVLLAQLLSNRQGCLMHSCGIIFKGKGFLFVGHSQAGKSTIAKMFKNTATILCDDRVIIRNAPGGFRIHGTWNHGEVPDVCAKDALLSAVFFLNKSPHNQIVKVEEKQISMRGLLACVVRPFITAQWWDKTLLTLESLCRSVPCYDLSFNLSGEIVDVLNDFINKEDSSRCTRRGGFNGKQEMAETKIDCVGAR